MAVRAFPKNDQLVLHKRMAPTTKIGALNGGLAFLIRYEFKGNRLFLSKRSIDVQCADAKTMTRIGGGDAQDNLV